MVLFELDGYDKDVILKLIEDIVADHLFALERHLDTIVLIHQCIEKGLVLPLDAPGIENDLGHVLPGDSYQFGYIRTMKRGKI
jgi:hypothetical protein